MYFPQKYQFKRIIINGNRVTIPIDAMESNGWKVGDNIIVTFEPENKEIKGMLQWDLQNGFMI
jgi:hypothetical protein